MQTNDITFAGNVGADAKERTFDSGTRIVTFPLCHSEKREGKETATWVRVKVFGGWCDTASQIKKGENVVVKGKLNVETYKDKDGVERTAVDIVAFSLGRIASSGPRPAASVPQDDETIPF
jgi:single stranded DNA-binding protein